MNDAITECGRQLGGWQCRELREGEAAHNTSDMYVCCATLRQAVRVVATRHRVVCVVHTALKLLHTHASLESSYDPAGSAWLSEEEPSVLLDVARVLEALRTIAERPVALTPNSDSLASRYGSRPSFRLVLCGECCRHQAPSAPSSMAQIKDR